MTVDIEKELGQNVFVQSGQSKTLDLQIVDFVPAKARKRRKNKYRLRL